MLLYNSDHMLSSCLLLAARISRERGGRIFSGATLQTEHGMLAADVVTQGHKTMCTVQCFGGASTVRQASAWLTNAESAGELALSSQGRAWARSFCRMEATASASRQPPQAALACLQGMPTHAASAVTHSRCYSTDRVWSHLQHTQPWHHRRAPGCHQQAQERLLNCRGFASRAQEAAQAQRQRLQKKSGEQGLYLVALVVGMVGLTYASVPLYRRVLSTLHSHHLHLLSLEHARLHEESEATAGLAGRRTSTSMEGCWVQVYWVD